MEESVIGGGSSGVSSAAMNYKQTKYFRI